CLYVGTATIQLGSSSSQASGEYQIGSECCPKCLSGSIVKTHCNEYRSTSCLPCMDGTFTDQPNGLERCIPCTNCDSGLGLRVKTPCTATSDTVCEPLEGFYCVSSVGLSCDIAQKHKRCKPGQYISQNGRFKPFHVSPTNVQVIKEQMQTIMKESLSEPSTSSCAAPVVVESKVIQLLHDTLYQTCITSSLLHHQSTNTMMIFQWAILKDIKHINNYQNSCTGLR
uniref:TNFR-Cys domain-containing protein n=1 Tax=Astatotilapia calliptera TaxID=8154 RepID=A0A3P8NBB2_ASTCA